MEDTRALAPIVLPPLSPRRLDPEAPRLAAMPQLRSALPIVVTTLGVTVLALAPAGESPALRIALFAIVLATSLYQAVNLRDRNRLMASERNASERMAEAEERLRTLLERLPAAIYLDRYRRSDGAFIEAMYVAPQMEDLTGYPAEALKADPDLWLTLIHPDDRERVVAVNVQGHLTGNPIEQEYRIIRADGRVIWIREEARIIESTSDTILSHGFLVDITDRKMLEQQLGRMAFQDPLTGLANRALFADRLGQALARSTRSGRYPAVLFLDLDDFKAVNDRLGHGAGDTMLQVVGERLRGAVRPADCVARLGGDEFAVLVEDVVGSVVATATADRLLRLLDLPIEIDGQLLSGRGSIGIAVATAGTVSPKALLRDADAAMYRAKAKGRGNWVLFDPDWHPDVVTTSRHGPDG